MTRSWIHHTRGRFVRQARVGLGDLREEHLSRQGFAGPVAMVYRTEGPNEVVRVEGEYRRREIDSADVVSVRRERSARRLAGAAVERGRRGRGQPAAPGDALPLPQPRRRSPLFRPSRQRRLRDRVRADRLRAGRLCLPAEIDDLPPSARRRATVSCLSSSRRSRSALPSTSRSAATRRSTRPCSTSRMSPITAGRRRRNTRCGSRRAAATTSILYRNDPLKTVGWKGDLFPLQVQHREHPADHVEPHSPRAVLLGDVRGAGFVVVSFVPQIAVADLDAEELPSYHRNIDMDEVILSHADGDPGGRRPGGFSFIPRKASCTAPPRKPAPPSTPSANPETCAHGPVSASIPISRSSRARHSRG